MLQAKLDSLRLARADYEKVLTVLKGRQEHFKIENSYILEQVERAKEYLDQVDTEVRQAVLEEYRVTENKKVSEGIQVKEVSRLEYDPKLAFDWATKHQVCLALDKNEFEHVAKALKGKSNNLEFVNVIVEPKVYIAKDL